MFKFLGLSRDLLDSGDLLLIDINMQYNSGTLVTQFAMIKELQRT